MIGALHVADQVIPVMPEELDGTGVRFASHISWLGSLGKVPLRPRSPS